MVGLTEFHNCVDNVAKLAHDDRYGNGVSLALRMLFVVQRAKGRFGSNASI